MRRYQLLLAILITALLFTGCQKKETDVEKYAKEEEQIMKTMMEEMDDIPDTKSAELDFLYGMIPHHESAVAMANSYLKYAKDDSAFQTLAENIVRTQNEEITQMREMIQRIEESGETDETKAEAYQKEYQAMMGSHHSMDGNSGADDLDQAFAEGMSMHHQMAVDMARAVVSYAGDQEVLQFAEAVIEVQDEEINMMQSYLSGQGDGQTHKH